LLVYTDAQQFAGAERALATMLAALDERVHVAVLGVDEDVAAAIAAARPGSELVVVRPVRDKRDIGAVRDHVRAVRRLEPDLFQANLRTSWSCQYGSLAALLYGRAALIAYEHAPLDIDSKIQRRLKRLLARRFAAHVAASAFAAKRVEEIAGLLPGSVRVIPCGVADEPASGTHAPGRTVAAIGRLVPEKGFDLLVRALALVPDATLVLVGDGPLRSELELLATRLGLRDRVDFRGWTYSVRAQLGEFDVVAVPSRFEAFGLTAVEAMLAERAVVATHGGGLPEVVEDGATGLLVPPDDVDALAAALRRLLDDRDLRRRLGSEGRARALARFAPEAAARAFEQLYEQVLA
jgi:glycosyltransferase involved in cell wall biosynthesis